jgi:hypothetical protein
MSTPTSPPPAPAPAATPAGAAPQAIVEQKRVGTRLRLTITFPVRTRLRRQRPDGRGEPAYFVQSFVIENGSAVAASGHLGPYMAATPLVEVDIIAARRCSSRGATAAGGSIGRQSRRTPARRFIADRLLHRYGRAVSESVT